MKTQSLFFITFLAISAIQSQLLSTRPLTEDSKLTKVSENGSLGVYPCGFYSPNSSKLFNFFPFKSGDYRSATLLNYQPTTEHLPVNAVYYYSICSGFNSVPADCPPGTRLAAAYVKYQEGTETLCDSIGSILDNNKLLWKYQIDFDGDKVTTGSEVKKIEVRSYHTEEKQESEKEILKEQNSSNLKEVVYTFNCAKEKSHTPSIVFYNPLTQKIELTFSTTEACGEDISNIVTVFKTYKIIPGLLLLVSVPLIFFGLQFIKKSLAVIGFLSLGLSTTAVVAVTLNVANLSIWVIIGYFVVLFIICSVFAFFCYNATKLAVYLAGGFLGFLVGAYISGVVQGLLYTGTGVVPVTIVVIFVIFGILLGHYVHDHIVIHSTAFGGAGLFAFSIGTILGNFPDFMHLKTDQKQDIDNEYIKWFWIYLLATLLLYIVGSAYQYKKRKERKDKVGGNQQILIDGYN